MLMKIGKIMDKVVTGVSMISYVGLGAIVLLTVVDVFLNKVFGSPILGAYEITEQLLLITVFASFAYAQRNHTHINMALVLVRLPRTLRFILFAIMTALSVGISAVAGYCAVMQGLKNYASGVVTSNLYIPMFPFTFLVALAMFGFAITLIYDMILSLVAIKNDEIAKQVEETWST